MHFRQDCDLVILTRFVSTLHVELEEAVKEHFACYNVELLFRLVRCYLDICLHQSGIRHLRCYSALPDEFIKSLLLRSSLDGSILYICRADGLVGLLCAFSLGLVLSYL